MFKFDKTHNIKSGTMLYFSNIIITQVFGVGFFFLANIPSIHIQFTADPLEGVICVVFP